MESRGSKILAIFAMLALFRGIECNPTTDVEEDEVDYSATEICDGCDILCEDDSTTLKCRICLLTRWVAIYFQRIECNPTIDVEEDEVDESATEICARCERFCEDDITTLKCRICLLEHCSEDAGCSSVPIQKGGSTELIEMCPGCETMCENDNRTRECRICVHMCCNGGEVCHEDGLSRIGFLAMRCSEEECYHNEEGFTVDTPTFVHCLNEEGVQSENMRCCWIGD